MAMFSMDSSLHSATLARTQALESNGNFLAFFRHFDSFVRS